METERFLAELRQRKRCLAYTILLLAIWAQGVVYETGTRADRLALLGGHYRSVAWMFGLATGALIGQLLFAARKRTLTDVVLHLADRVEKLEDELSHGGGLDDTQPKVAT
jgi:hypothetical protein